MMISTLIAFIAVAFGVINAFYIEKRNDVGAKCGCLPRQFGGNYELRFLNMGGKYDPYKDLTTFILEGRIVINMDELKFYVTLTNRKRLAGRGGNDEAGWYGPMNYALMADLTKNIISSKTGNRCANAYFKWANRQWKNIGTNFEIIRCYPRYTESSTVSNRTDDSGMRMTFMLRRMFSAFNLTYSLADCQLIEISGFKFMPRGGKVVYPKFDIKIDKLDAKELDGVKPCDGPMRVIPAYEIPSLLPYPFDDLPGEDIVFDFL
ncbi:uncharacterized protein LOC141904654 [Tubulanus polymorphus]|uniref:uncharacterized protein LOC141904654 n=1 Tax=Tubulanus polymorphus TaxID=672921 RepID=UPI003DA5C2F3